MMALFELRAKLTALYQKYDFIIRFLLKFCLILWAFMIIRGNFSANALLSKTIVVLAFSFICTLLPFSLTLLVMMAYLALEIFSASSLMAVTVLIFCLILYCFFLRFTPDQGAAVIAVPVLRQIAIPYAVPLTLGAFGDLFSIIPVCCGVFLYYMLEVIKNNLNVTIETLTKNTDAAFEIYINVIDQLIKNPALYVTMIAYALAVIVVYFVRRMKMDYSFEISIAVGTAVVIVINLIGSLKYDMGTGVVAMIFGTLISGVLTFIFQFFYRTLNYAATENVQFEDDDYYYYVKAVPKLRADAPVKPVRKVMTKHTRDEEEDEELLDEVMDAFDVEVKKEEQNLHTELGTSAKQKTETIKKSVLKQVEDDDLFEDENEEEEAVPKKQAPVKPVSAKPAAPASAKKATTVTKDGKTLNVIYDDDDDDEE